MIIKIFAILCVLAVAAVAAVGFLTVRRAQAAESYRQCYRQSMHERDFRFEACRQVTEDIKHDYHLGAP